MSVVCPVVLLSTQWIVSCTRITCIQPLSRCSLTFLASSFFSDFFLFCCCFLFLFFSSSFFFLFSTMRSFFYLLAISYPLVSLPFCISVFVCICSHPDALSSVVLISDLLYQSAAFVFPDGSRVSELVMVTLAFHLFVVGTAIFTLCSYGFDCSRPLLCCRQ